MPGGECRQTLAVEPGDQVGDGVPALATGRSGGLLVVGTARHRQEYDGAGDANGGRGVRPTQASQLVTFLTCERAERILPAAGHGNSWGGWDTTKGS